jgi:large subunit ribosomal protein L27
MSAVKSGGNSKNGRDSNSKRLGLKISDGQFTLSGGIIFRQRGTKIHPGKNVGKGRDDTLFSKINGYVKYENKKNRKYVSVYINK